MEQASAETVGTSVSLTRRVRPKTVTTVTNPVNQTEVHDSLSVKQTQTHTHCSLKSYMLYSGPQDSNNTKCATSSREQLLKELGFGRKTTDTKLANALCEAPDELLHYIKMQKQQVLHLEKQLQEEGRRTEQLQQCEVTRPEPLCAYTAHLCTRVFCAGTPQGSPAGTKDHLQYTVHRAVKLHQTSAGSERDFGQGNSTLVLTHLLF